MAPVKIRHKTKESSRKIKKTSDSPRHAELKTMLRKGAIVRKAARTGAFLLGRKDVITVKELEDFRKKGDVEEDERMVKDIETLDQVVQQSEIDARNGHAPELKHYQMPPDRLPARLYRAQYPTTRVKCSEPATKGKTCLHAEDQASFKDPGAFGVEEFQRMVLRNITWTKKPVPFINVFDDWGHSYNWGNIQKKKCKKASDEIIRYMINTAELVRLEIPVFELSTLCAKLGIDLIGTDAGGDKGAYLILHEVPASAIVAQTQIWKGKHRSAGTDDEEVDTVGEVGATTMEEGSEEGGLSEVEEER